jgi:predicted RND superfamily exporter protein
VPQALWIFVCTIAAMLFMFLLIFRSLRGMVLPLVAGLINAVWGLGLLAMLNFNLDPLVLVFPFLIAARTASHAVQVLKRYTEEAFKLQEIKAACKKVISSMIVPGTSGVITETSGIIIIAITPIKLLYKICLICGFWALGSVFIALILVPVLLSYLPLQAEKEGEGFLDKLLLKQGRWICRYGKYPIVIIGIIATVWGYSQREKMPVGNVVPGSEILWPFHRYNVDSFRLIFNMPLLNPMYIVCEGDKPFTQMTPTVIRDVLKFVRYMSRTPNQRVMFVGSLAGPIPNYNRAVRDSDPKWIFAPTVDMQLKMLQWVILTTGAPGAWDKYLDADQQRANIVLYLRDKTADSLREVIDRINKFIAEESLANKPVKDIVNKAETTFTFKYRLAGGTAGVQAGINETLVKYNKLTTIIAFILCFIFVAITFQSFVGAIIITVPLLTATFLTEAFMSLNNPPLPLTTATLPVASLGMGLGVDYAIYLVGRIIEEYRDNKRELNDAIVIALGTTGKAIIYIATTLIVSLAFFFFSKLMFQALMGLLMAIVLFINMLGALFLVPSIIVLVKPKFITSQRK